MNKFRGKLLNFGLKTHKINVFVIWNSTS